MNGKNWWSTTPPSEFVYDKYGHLVANGLKVKFKKLYSDATAPSYAKNGDAGLDLTATHMTWGDTYIEYGTGIAVEIPNGYVGFVFPRSSVSKKEDFYLKNAVGVIDSGYRGEIKLRFSKSDDHYQPGEKVGQLIIMPYPTIQLEEVDDLSNTDRGDGGFGSTGR
jgi:dUTP pyrophosphatase